MALYSIWSKPFIWPHSVHDAGDGGRRRRPRHPLMRRGSFAPVEAFGLL
jgi:hypothetical protein